MNRAVAALGVRSVIDRFFACDDARRASHPVKAAGRFGKIVVAMAKARVHEFVINIPAAGRVAKYMDSIYYISI